MRWPSLGQTAAEVSCLPSPVPKVLSEIVATNLMHSITWHRLDGHETPQKSHWGVTQVFSKNWFNVKTAFASMDALKPLSPIDSSNIGARRRRLESSTLQKKFDVK